MADQQLAGVIMWVPVGMLYWVVTVTILGVWLNSFAEREDGLLPHPPVQPQPGQHPL